MTNLKPLVDKKIIKKRKSKVKRFQSDQWLRVPVRIKIPNHSSFFVFPQNLMTF
jgi:hypothetical protein